MTRRFGAAAALLGVAVAVAAAGFVVLARDREAKPPSGAGGGTPAPEPAPAAGRAAEPAPTAATLAASAAPAAESPAGAATLGDVERAMRQTRYEALLAYLKANPKAADAEEAWKAAMDLARGLGHWGPLVEHGEAFLAAFPASDDALEVRLSKAAALDTLDKRDAAKAAYAEALKPLKAGGAPPQAIFDAYRAYANFLVETDDVEGARKALDDLVALFKDDDVLGTKVKEAAESLKAPMALLGAEPPAPAEVVKDMDGKEIRFGDFKGKVLLIDFWATWCTPCRAEMPNVVAAYKKWHDRGFEILGVTLDHEGAEAEIREFTAKMGMTWRQHYDGLGWANPIAELFGVHGIPAAFLVGRDGKVVRCGLRGASLERTLAKLLK